MTVIENFAFDTSNFLFLLLLFILTYISQFYFRYFTRQNPVPGPIPFPLIGNLETYHSNSSKWANVLHKKYGDIFEVYFGGLFSLNNRQIWISNANLNDKLLKSSYTNNNFPYRTTESEGLDRMGMTNKGVVFNRDVNSWVYNRKILTQIFMSPKLLKQSVINTEKLFREMENYWEKLEYFTEGQGNNELDLTSWMSRFMTDSVFNLTTNTNAYALNNYFNKLNKDDKEDEKENDDHLSKESETFVNYIRLHFIACAFFKDTPKLLRTIVPAYRKKSKELLDAVAWLNKKVLELIEERRKEIENAKQDEELSPDMLTLLLTFNTNRDPKYARTTNDDDARPMSEDEVRENVYEVMGAGIDTTSNTFCYVVYYLSRYPEVRQKMLQEMENVFGKDTNYELTYENVNKLNYCEAIIKEVSRLMPTVSVLFRVSAKPDEIAGYKFPANTQFLIDIPTVQMHPAYWREPEKFDPDRFMDDNQQIPKNALLYFGGGAKICLGKQLAILQLKALMFLLYRKYDVELADMSGSIKYISSVVNHCEELPVKIKVKN